VLWVGGCVARTVVELGLTNVFFSLRVADWSGMRGVRGVCLSSCLCCCTRQASLDAFIDRLCVMFDSTIQGARWCLVALAYKTTWLKHVLLQCPHPTTRRAFARLIVVSVMNGSSLHFSSAVACADASPHVACGSCMA